MESRVETLDEHGNVLTTFRHPDPGIATLRYSRLVLHHPQTHVRLIEGDALPGLPDKVIAQRFGDPCEAPCCVPLNDEWPEHTK